MLPSDKGIDLLLEIIRNGNFYRAEKLIISWFLKNPIDSADSIANIYLELCHSHFKWDSFVDSNVIDDCIGGARFNRNGTEYLQLLVDKPYTEQLYFLDLNSSIGKLIANMEVGEKILDGIEEITLIERKTPFNAVCQISLKITEEKNVGKNWFTSFPVSEDNPDNTISLVKRLLLINKNNNKNKITEVEGVLNNHDIPLMWKGTFISNNPIEAALKLLCDEKAYFSLPDFGIETPPKIILDVYAITYLAITGLVHAIDKYSNYFVITYETKKVIENWLNNINREEYFSLFLNSDDFLCRVTADDIREATQEMQNYLRLILTKTTVIKPCLTNIPPLMLNVEDICDISVYSSACLAISNEIAWLCIDKNFAAYFYSFGCKQVANTVKLLCSLGNELTFEQKKKGIYLYAEQKIPYPLLFNDLILLSNSSDDKAHYFLAKLIYQHNRTFPDAETAIKFLTKLLIPVLNKAYLDGQFVNGLRVTNPSNNGYAERVFNACCYVSMQCERGVIAEKKIAMFLFKLFSHYRVMPPMMKFILILANCFVQGHFLDIPLINDHLKSEAVHSH